MRYIQRTTDMAISHEMVQSDLDISSGEKTNGVGKKTEDIEIETGPRQLTSGADDR